VKIAARLSVFISSFLFLFFILFLVTPRSFAQYGLPTNNDPNVPRNLHTYSQNVLLNVLSSFSCVLTGIDPLEPGSKCLGVDPITKRIGYVDGNGGALAGMGDLIGMTYNLPIHTSDYTSYLAANFGLVKKVYADSPGYTGLQPLVQIWIVFRDFAYILFVLVFVIVGIAIMLRIKIDPRTVMTIQNQIPKLIIGLVLVTLSFAIAGLLIDVMWLICYLIISVFSSVDPKLDALGLVNNLSKDPFNFLSNALRGGEAFFPFGAVWDMAKSIGGIVGDVVKMIISSIMGGFMGWLIGGAIRGIVDVVAFCIIPIVIFYVLIRLWFTLIQSFIMILINVIFAPLWILAGLLPSKQAGFGGWIKSMLANLSVFPAVVLMFILGKVFIDLLGGGSNTTFTPPLVGVGTGTLNAILALGVILLTPNIANMTKAAFKSPNLNLSSMTKALSAGAAVPKKAISSGIGFVTRGSYDPYNQKWNSFSLKKAVGGMLSRH